MAESTKTKGKQGFCFGTKKIWLSRDLAGPHRTELALWAQRPDFEGGVWVGDVTPEIVCMEQETRDFLRIIGMRVPKRGELLSFTGTGSCLEQGETLDQVKDALRKNTDKASRGALAWLEDVSPYATRDDNPNRLAW